MPSVKRPCVQCRDKHVKCDEETPACRRCQTKNLPCSRPARTTIFRNKSTASFNRHRRGDRIEIEQFPTDQYLLTGRISTPKPGTRETTRTSFTNARIESATSPRDGAPDAGNEIGGPLPQARNHAYSTHVNRRPDLYLPSIAPSVYYASSRHTNVLPDITQPAGGVSSRRCSQFPLKSPQEACLLRYFVEELAHWFDLCDEKRHFQLAVPILARHHPHLLHSIFALAARHLTRVPKYQTPRGILYQGQLLPGLRENDAVEYMLKCIPALREFHVTQDDESVESILATAVILRQLEEIDDEEDQSGRQSTNGEAHEEPRPKEQVNFLAIIDAVLRSPPSQALFGRRSLIQAAYWMGVRQEIYHSFTRKHPPQMVLDPEYAQGASKANRIVIHTAQVSKWRWADGSLNEWLRLQRQGELLQKEALEFQPFFRRAADRSKGDIFPTVWYSSVLEVTSIQLSIIAKMVLLVENPYLHSQPTTRTQWRAIENEVRGLLLELCGICICHPACPPALIHTAIGLELYGDFFTDEYERAALQGVVDKLRDARAWPAKKLSDMFR